jgi:hypothetical protein
MLKNTIEATNLHIKENPKEKVDIFKYNSSNFSIIAYVIFI